MGKLILYDDNVQNVLKETLLNRSISTGLLIGHAIPQRDMVMHACPTPDEKEPSKEGHPKEINSKIEDLLSEEWICLHAKQVIRMLPGGLDVLGLFVVASAESFKKNESLIRQILFAIFKSIKKYQNIYGVAQNSERVILNLCPVTKKYICQTIDVADYKSFIKSADWKSLSTPLVFHQLGTRFSLDHKFAVLKKHEGQWMGSPLLEGLSSLFKQIETAPALINKELHNLNSLLDPSHDSKQPKIFNVKLFQTEEESKSSIQVWNACAFLNLRGSIQARAYVLNKATVKEGIDALKQDIIRSLVARCEIQSEDLFVIDEEQKDPEIVLDLPRRAYAPLGQLSVCDYLFQDDQNQYISDVFQELLYLKVDDESIEIDLEKSPSFSTLFQPEHSRQSSSCTTPIDVIQEKHYVPIIVASLGVAISSILIFIYFN